MQCPQPRPILCQQPLVTTQIYASKKTDMDLHRPSGDLAMVESISKRIFLYTSPSLPGPQPAHTLGQQTMDRIVLFFTYCLSSSFCCCSFKPEQVINSYLALLNSGLSYFPRLSISISNAIIKYMYYPSVVH